MLIVSLRSVSFASLGIMCPRWMELQRVRALSVVCGAILGSAFASAQEVRLGQRSDDGKTAEAPRLAPDAVRSMVTSTCLDCHDGPGGEGGLDLSALSFELSDRDRHHTWVKVYDRVRSGEMPPPEYDPVPEEIDAFVNALRSPLREADHVRAGSEGRSVIRRLNRQEYENTLRAVLDAPWLRVAELMPADGTSHLFSKSGERLDVSHVQIERTIATAEAAVRSALRAAAFRTETKKYYAREEPSIRGYLWYRPGQMAATRSVIPLLGTTAQPEVIRKEIPVTVGESDPETREREAMGVVSGTYTATLKYDFTRAAVPTDGTYRLRMKSYTFTAGPGGRNGGTDHGLTTGKAAWWRPDRNVAFPGTRTEPITLYALKRSGDSRWLSVYDATPEPTVSEHVVDLEAGDMIRPDAGRLVRTRPGWTGNPHATPEGIPGFAMNWLEVEGPLHPSWPPPSYTALFDDLAFDVVTTKRSDGSTGRGRGGAQDRSVTVRSDAPREDAARLLARLYQKAARRPVAASDIAPFLAVYDASIAAGESFTEAMIGAFVSVLVSPDVLLLSSPPGRLDEFAIASRLAYFLTNSPPDERLRQAAEAGQLTNPSARISEATRLLEDARSARFVHAFLDQWLDLGELATNSPDAELYPDYYLDDQLTEASLEETRLFFTQMIREDRPVRNLIDSPTTFVNERLGRHYGLDVPEGVSLREVTLPAESPRGGLLGQASVLRVTANGTTTSPVVRGAWVVERLLGLEIPPPPSGIDAIEPDIRGAVTIREQLEQHRAIASCAACHQKFDPVGLALESFDVAGGWQDRYRSLGTQGDRVEGYGKNGHRFSFRLAQPVDPTGVLADGRAFDDVRTLKRYLVADERALARNLVNRLVVYATGAPVAFGDREAVEAILDGAAPAYGMRSLIVGVVESPLFTVR